MNEKYITISAEILEGTHLKVKQVVHKLDGNWDSTVDMILAIASAKIFDELDEITSTKWVKKAIASDSIKSVTPEGTKDSNLTKKIDDYYQEIKDDLVSIQTEGQEQFNHMQYDANLLREDLDNRLVKIETLLNRLVSATEALATVSSELAAKGVK